MLVTSLSKDKNNKCHVLNRVEERMGVEKVEWFLNILAEINLYLPDDWRMTKSSNNFLIQIVTPQNHLSLVGRSYKRVNSEGVISIIDTVLHKGAFDVIEANSGDTAPGKRINRIEKANNPEMLQPNLYFFQPCPDDSISPLFARQYERIKLNKNKKPVGTQFHRIHPLTKSGLDLEHYRWVKWDINGNLEFVDYPDDDYHGKDYWQVPYINSGKDRADEQRYQEHYNNLLSKYKLENSPGNHKPYTPFEKELKYIFHGKTEEFNSLLELLKKRLEQEGFVAYWNQPKEQTDTYFDDEERALYKAGVSFRLRKTKGASRITLKKRIPLTEKDCPVETYMRMEEEVAINRKQEEALFRGERINPFPYRLIAYLAPECKSLKNTITVRNKRKSAILSYGNSETIELCHDTVYFTSSAQEVGPFFQLEIENKGAEDLTLNILGKILEEDYGLILSSETKYEQGIRLLYLENNQHD